MVTNCNTLGLVCHSLVSSDCWVSLPVVVLQFAAVFCCCFVGMCSQSVSLSSVAAVVVVVAVLILRFLVPSLWRH